MTDDEFRADYFARVQALKAEWLAVRQARPRRTIWQKVADLLRPSVIHVEPKRVRSSGPTLNPCDWHEPAPNALLPHRCLQCGEEMLPGATIRDTRGLCGPCSKHGQGNPMPPAA